MYKTAANIAVREFLPHELGKGLEIRNGIFAPITAADWGKVSEKTAAIACSGDKAIGFIPLYLRKFKLAPGVTITAAFENAVGTQEGYRGLGVGTAMINAACSFLRGKADALMVYRSDENSAGYNFYKKTGHEDLLYMRRFTYDRVDPGKDRHIDISTGIGNILGHEQEILDIFNETYQDSGGYPTRYAGYWTGALHSPVFSSHLMEFRHLRYMHGDYTTAYVIAGKGAGLLGKPSGSRLQILEMAARKGSGEAIRALLKSACSLACSEGLEGLEIVTDDHNPFSSILNSSDFIQSQRDMQIMALNFDSKALFDKAWKSRFHLPGVELSVWTPGQEVTLLESHGCSKRVILEMKKDTFTKWLMGRIDFKARVYEGTITVLNGSRQINDEIARAIPFCPWTYHHLDFT